MTPIAMVFLIDVITGVLNNDDKMMTYVFLDVIRSYYCRVLSACTLKLVQQTLGFNPNNC